MSTTPKGTFRSLRVFNFRMWAAGAIVSNIGTWMQRTAQDWIVLTHLTSHNATAVGIVMALQFGPQVLLLPITGFAADHLDRRKLLFATQAAMGLLASRSDSSPSPASSACGTSMSSHSFSAASPPSTRLPARPSSPT